MILKLGALTTGDMVMVLVAVVVWYGLALVSLASTLSQPRNKEIKILNIFINRSDQRLSLLVVNQLCLPALMSSKSTLGWRGGPGGGNSRRPTRNVFCFYQ